MRFWAGAALLALVAAVVATVPQETPVVLTVGTINVPELRPGDSAQVEIPLSIARGYHVNANPAASEDYIPLEIVLPETLGVKIGPASYPAGNTWRLEGGTEDLLVYDGRVTVRVPLYIAADAPGGELGLAGRIEFQACDHQLCLLPDSRPLTVRLKIVAQGATKSAE